MIIDQEPPNIYQLPTCPICINPLVQDINCLSCGHSYHYSCIAQHFQYKGTCPSCQKRANLKELRRVVYRPIALKGVGEKHLDKLLNEMQHSETKPFQYMVSQVRKYAQLNEKLEKQNQKYQEKLQEKNIRHEQNLKIIQSKQEQNKKLKDQNKALKKVMLIIEEKKKALQLSMAQQQQVLEQLLQKEKEFRQIQKYKIWVHENNQQLSNHYEELCSNGTPKQQIAQTFFNLTMLKSLQIAKTKLSKDQNSEQLQKRQKQNLRLNTYIEKLKKEKETLREEKMQQQKKYQQLKIKYRTLREKIKNNNENKTTNIESEFSNGYDSRKSQPSIIEEIQRPILKKHEKVPITKPVEQNKDELQVKYGGFQFKSTKMTTLKGFMIKK